MRMKTHGKCVVQDVHNLAQRTSPCKQAQNKTKKQKQKLKKKTKKKKKKTPAGGKGLRVGNQLLIIPNKKEQLETHTRELSL